MDKPKLCANCAHWDSVDGKMGYCKLMPLLFAFTLQPTVYAITKKDWLCEKFEFYYRK